MERIIIISDTHNNQFLLRKVLSVEQKYQYLFHLGDNYEDLDSNLDLIKGVKLHKVPGIYHRGYLNGRLTAIKTVEIHSWKFLIVHDLKDYIRNSVEAEIVCYGHTHQFNLEKQGKKLFLNPGHLKDLQDKGRIASYAVLEIDNKMIRIEIKDIEQKILKELEIYKQNPEVK